MRYKKAAIVALVALVTLGGYLAWLTAGILQAQQNVPSTGNVAGQLTSSINIGVYSDAAGTVNCTGINWGTLTVGGTATHLVYVKNTGNTTETLSMLPSNWIPASASSALTLGWNQEGIQLTAGQTVAATITLTVAPGTSGISNFSFNIVISGTA